ncbi:hypothetical protein INT48_005592 [Thamnidium elegans]|uniref:HTH APSES-type domain-containing protein n=1 Tax=Thamnidium elegans TaxID=101142 RepID=A0A8H7T0A7_9FUNG|nr:hypothetical protein INT48_005592 [Thamnidium elegans]
MEGIYQSNLYSSQQLPYALPPSHPEQHSYSHYGNPQQYRSSAFSDARSSPTSSSTPYHHSAGLNNASSSNSYASHGDMNHPNNHHHHHHHHDTTNNNPNDNSYHHTNSTAWNSSSPNLSWNSSPPPPLPPPSRNNSYGGYGSNNNNNTLPHMSAPMQRPKLTTTVWEDEGTLCYQVDAKSVCVARRQGRVVVKVGAMHLKGVWITFSRAKDLATKFKIVDILYPLFVDDPSIFLSMPPPPPVAAAGSTGVPIMLPSSINTPRGYYNKNENFGSFILMRSQQTNQLQNSGSCSPVPGTIAPILSNDESDMYLLNNSYEYRNNGNRFTNNGNSTTSAPATASSTATSTSTNQHSYNIYPSDHSTEHFSSPYENHTSPYLQTNRKVIEKEEDKRSIDFPSSPPPESSSTHALKYSNSSPYQSPPSWSETDRKSPLGSSSLRTAGLVMVPGRHPLSSEIEEKSFTKGRKRGHQQEKSITSIPVIQRKRMKHTEKGASP